MRRTHLAIQAAIVLAMVSFISWPQFRPLHAQTVWRYSPQAIADAQAADTQRFSSENANAARTRFRVNAASYVGGAPTTAARRTDIERSEPYTPPLGVAALGAKVNALIGLAKNTLNVPIPFARVVLRNSRTGEVVARVIADSQGKFTFLDLNSEVYVLELIGQNGAVVATSTVSTLVRGELRQTELRAPVTATTVAAVVGNNYNSTLQQTQNVANASGVTRTSSALQTQESSR